MKQKLAAFYLIGQFDDWWEQEFYVPQMNVLSESGLYDELDFIDIHIAGGRNSLPFIPNKTRNITFQSKPLFEERELMKSIHQFANENYEYKILHFHSEGVTRKNSVAKNRKLSWRALMEYCTIKLWKESTDLLNFYDCVGADYIHQATFGNNAEYVFKAPHFPGMFWWTNASYFKTLDKDYLKQSQPWSRYLAELWIGSKNPSVYKMYHVKDNYYYENLQIKLDEIEENVKNHLIKIKTQTRENILLCAT